MLDALESKCRERRIRLADMTVTAQELLSKAGIEQSLRSIAKHVNRSMPAGGPPGGRCVDVFAAYVTLRKGSR